MPTACKCERDCGFTPQVDCSSRRAAAAALKVVGGSSDLQRKRLEVCEPGSGLITVTWTVPACALVAVPVAVSSVEEINVVGRNEPPNDTTAPLTKRLAVTTRVKLPTGMVVGSTASRPARIAERDQCRWQWQWYRQSWWPAPESCCGVGRP